MTIDQLFREAQEAMGLLQFALAQRECRENNITNSRAVDEIEDCVSERIGFNKFGRAWCEEPDRSVNLTELLRKNRVG
jgi:hypothetical protein